MTLRKELSVFERIFRSRICRGQVQYKGKTGFYKYSLVGTNSARFGYELLDSGRRSILENPREQSFSGWAFSPA